MEKHWILKRIDDVTRVVVIICGMAMLIAVLMGIFARFVVHYGVPFTEELPRFLMVWFALFSCPLALDLGYHASFNALADHLGKRLRFINFLLTRLLIIGFLAIVVYYGFGLMDRIAFQIAPTLGISMAIPYASMPLSATLLLLKYVLEVFCGVKKELATS